MVSFCFCFFLFAFFFPLFFFNAVQPKFFSQCQIKICISLVKMTFRQFFMNLLLFKDLFSLLFWFVMGNQIALFIFFNIKQRNKSFPCHSNKWCIWDSKHTLMVFLHPTEYPLIWVGWFQIKFSFHFNLWRIHFPDPYNYMPNLFVYLSAILLFIVFSSLSDFFFLICKRRETETLF